MTLPLNHSKDLIKLLEEQLLHDLYAHGMCVLYIEPGKEPKRITLEEFNTQSTDSGGQGITESEIPMWKGEELYAPLKVLDSSGSDAYRDLQARVLYTSLDSIASNSVPRPLVNKSELILEVA